MYLVWPKLSGLVSHMQCVFINGAISDQVPLTCGVPQGFVLSLLPFSLYTTLLSVLLGQNGWKHHLYADDTQLYIPFDMSSSSNSLTLLSNVFGQIQL